MFRWFSHLRPGFYQTRQSSSVECDVLLPDGSSACLGGDLCVAQRLDLPTPPGCNGVFGFLAAKRLFLIFLVYVYTTVGNILHLASLTSQLLSASGNACAEGRAHDRTAVFAVPLAFNFHFPGSTGMLCGECPEGFSRDNYPELCQPCPSGASALLSAQTLIFLSELLTAVERPIFECQRLEFSLTSSRKRS